MFALTAGARCSIFPNFAWWYSTLRPFYKVSVIRLPFRSIVPVAYMYCCFIFCVRLLQIVRRSQFGSSCDICFMVVVWTATCCFVSKFCLWLAVIGFPRMAVQSEFINLY